MSHDRNYTRDHFEFRAKLSIFKPIQKVDPFICLPKHATVLQNIANQYKFQQQLAQHLYIENRLNE